MPALIKNRQENGSISDAIMGKKPKASIDIEIAPENKHLECAQAILSAVKSGDAHSLADALQSMFQDLDSEPHEEAEHIQPHSYEASKED